MYRTLLVPTDGSPRAGKALKAAARMARGSGARLHILNVQPTFISAIAPVPDAAMQLSKGEYDEAVETASARILRKAERFARSQGVKCRTLSVLSDSVPRAIVRAVLATCRIPVLVHR